MSGQRYRYMDKVVIITGACKGIGRGCVEIFVENGAKVVFCSIDEKEGKKTESEVNAVGPGTSLFILCDVTKEDQIKNVVQKTVEAYGQIDCLINNVGIHPPFAPIDDVTADDFSKLFNLNVLSYFLFAKYCLPHIRKTQGSIVNSSSLVAQIGQCDAVAYVTTKGAITAMTKAMAIDEARYGVRVNSISPSNIWTPLHIPFSESSGDVDKYVADVANVQLLGRIGTARECGEACLFLAAEAQFCTGTDLHLSGGAELNYGYKNQSKQKNGNKDFV